MKTVTKITLVSSLAMVFVGCGGHMVEVGKIPQKADMIAQIKVQAPKAMFQAETRNRANTLALEASAMATLKNGYRYFSISRPKGAVSNTSGSLIKSAKEYLKTCNTNSTAKEMGASMLTLGLFSVSLYDSCHIANKSGNGSGWIEIYAFKKEPLNYTSYDAKKVIEYLKEKKLYIDVPKGEFVEKIVSKKE